MNLSSVIQRIHRLYFILVFLDHAVRGMYHLVNLNLILVEVLTVLDSVNNIIAHGIPDEFRFYLFLAKDFLFNLLLVDHSRTVTSSMLMLLSS